MQDFARDRVAAARAGRGGRRVVGVVMASVSVTLALSLSSGCEELRSGPSSASSSVVGAGRSWGVLRFLGGDPVARAAGRLDGVVVVVGMVLGPREGVAGVEPLVLGALYRLLGRGAEAGEVKLPAATCFLIALTCSTMARTVGFSEPGQDAASDSALYFEKMLGFCSTSLRSS